MAILDRENNNYLMAQPGKQSDFIFNKAKVVVYGGGAGAGRWGYSNGSY